VVEPDRALGACDLVPEVHPAAEGPAHLELAHGAGLELDQRDRVVLVGDGVDERVSVAEDLDRPVPLADEAPDDLDAVAAKVDDRAAAGQPPVPEPRRVGTRMRLARPDPRHVADRPALHRRDGLQGLGRVAEVLEVPAEDPGRLDRLEHPLGFLRRPTERLRAQDRLARLGHQPDDLLVQEVRQADDHDVRVRVVDRRLEVRRRVGDRPALAERVGPVLAPRVDDADPVAAALAVERVRVEVADQAGAEHRDGVGLHRAISSGSRTLPRIRSRPWTRERSLGTVR
jgi:hypothetical protein